MSLAVDFLWTWSILEGKYKFSLARGHLLTTWPRDVSQHNSIQMNVFFHSVTPPISRTALSSCAQEPPLSWEAHIKILRLQIKIKEPLSGAQQSWHTDGPLTRIYGRTSVMISDSCHGHEPEPGLFDWLWSCNASLMTCFFRGDVSVCAPPLHDWRGFSCRQVNPRTTDLFSLWVVSCLTVLSGKVVRSVGAVTLLSDLADISPPMKADQTMEAVFPLQFFSK